MAYKIMVIEDNEEVRENICEILELSGYEVNSAENGKVGVRKIKEDLPDLILCDIMMPELDGYGVLHILQRTPETSGIPFIFLTAKSERTDFRKGMNLGADDYITKPFEEVQLMEAIELRLQKSADSGRHVPIDNSQLDCTEMLECLEPLAEESESRSYPKKAPVFLEGAFPRYVFRIVEGSVKVSQWTESGKELIVRIFNEGEYFGWSNALLDKAYHSIGSALEDTVLQLIPKEKFIQMLDEERRLYRALLINSIQANNVLADSMVKTAYESVRKRMSHILIRLYGEEKERKIKLLREDIAALAGISKETAIRVLSSFREEGLISIEHNEIIIHDKSALENIIG